MFDRSIVVFVLVFLHAAAQRVDGEVLRSGRDGPRPGEEGVDLVEFPVYAAVARGLDFQLPQRPLLDLRAVERAHR